jgi:signal transduction histidine kinase
MHLIFWNVVALVLLVGGLGIVCRFVTVSYLIGSVDRELDHSIEMYRRPPRFIGSWFARAMSVSRATPSSRARTVIPAGSAGGGSIKIGPPRPPDANNPYRTHFFTVQGQSAMPDDSRPIWDVRALVQALRGETLHTTVWVGGEPVRVLSAFGFTPKGAPGVVQKAYPLKETDRAIAGVDTALLLLLPAGLLGAGWLGAALTDRVLKPVERLTQAAGGAGGVDFSRRLPVSGEDEFARLAGTFNGLLDRLDRAFQDQSRLLQLQQRFTGDASHELKTPLTIIKGRAGMAVDRISTDTKSRHEFQEIATAATAMTELVQDLLLLAHADEGQLGRDVQGVSVREALDSAMAATLEGRGAPITLEIERKDLRFRGNQGELVRLFRNLLDNAVRYTPPEGKITVRAQRVAAKIMVTVEDTGMGIAPEHLPHLGERFYRVDASRTRPTGGTGLGLSICRSIVEAHGGELRFQSMLGVGTTATVILPKDGEAETA